MYVCVSVKGGGGRRLKSTHGKVFVRSEGRRGKKKCFCWGNGGSWGEGRLCSFLFLHSPLFFRSGKCTSVSRKPFFSKQNAPRRHHPPVYEALLLQQMLFGRRKERGKEGATNIGISMQGEKEKRKKPFGNREWEESPFTIFAEGGRRSRLSAAISIAKKE